MGLLLRKAALGFATALTASACLAGAPSRVMPAPGLYQLDRETVQGPIGGKSHTKTRTDGATGDTVVEYFENGKFTNKHAVKGSAPVTHCYKSFKEADALALLPLLPMTCKNTRMTETRDGAIVTASCAGTSPSLVIRQLSPQRWEHVYESQYGAPGGVPDMSSMIPILKMQAKNAPDEKARAEAEKMLADMGRLQQELAKMKASAPANMPQQAGAKPTTSVRSRVLLTRIGDACQ